MVIGLVLFFAGLIALFFYLDRKRAEKIQAVATRLGYTFRRKPTDADKTLIVGCHIPGHWARGMQVPVRFVAPGA